MSKQTDKLKRPSQRLKNLTSSRVVPAIRARNDGTCPIVKDPAFFLSTSYDFSGRGRGSASELISFTLQKSSLLHSRRRYKVDDKLRHRETWQLARTD